MSKTIKLKNFSDITYRFEIGLLPGQAPMKYEVAPGEVCEVPRGYYESSTKGRRSMIQRRAPGLRPADSKAEVSKKAEAPKAKPAPAKKKAEVKPSPAKPAASSDSLFKDPVAEVKKTKKKWAKARKSDK